MCYFRIFTRNIFKRCEFYMRAGGTTLKVHADPNFDGPTKCVSMELQVTLYYIKQARRFVNHILPNFCAHSISHYDFDHLLIHCIRLITDSTNSCPLELSLYFTRGGIRFFRIRQIMSY